NTQVIHRLIGTILVFVTWLLRAAESSTLFWWESRYLIQLFCNLWPQLAHDVVPRQDPHCLCARLVINLAHDDHLLIAGAHVIQGVLNGRRACNIEGRP